MKLRNKTLGNLYALISLPTHEVVSVVIAVKSTQMPKCELAAFFNLAPRWILFKIIRGILAPPMKAY